MNIQLSNIVSQSEQQVSTEIDGETVMMSVEQGMYYGLDVIGSRIWQLLENPISVSEMLEKLLYEYEDKENTCEQDLLVLLDDLYKQELIHVCDNKN